MKLIIFGNEMMKEKRKCSLCKRNVDEGYLLRPNPEESEILTEKLSDEISDWFVCEPCLGGQCLQPTKWFWEVFGK